MTNNERAVAMKDLILPVRREFFEQIKAKTKQHEFRERKEYWRKRLVGRSYDRVIVTLGYPKKDDHDKRIVCNYHGYYERTLEHHHFGPDPIEVYAINVSDQLEERSAEDES